jgi:hypothetical protein
LIKLYTIPPNVDAQGLCNLIYNTQDAMYDLLQRNSFITSSSQSLINYAGQQVSYDDSLVVKKPVQINYTIVQPTSNIGKIKALAGQNIYDLVLSTYGTLDLLNKFVSDNSIAEINMQFSGQIYSFDTSLIQRQVRNQYNSANGIVYSTSFILQGLLLGDFNNDFNNDFFN